MNNQGKNKVVILAAAIAILIIALFILVFNGSDELIEQNVSQNTTSAKDDGEDQNKNQDVDDGQNDTNKEGGRDDLSAEEVANEEGEEGDDSSAENTDDSEEDVKDEGPQEEQEEEESASLGGRHIFGDPNAPITIVEYSDFQCPICRRLHPVLPGIIEKYDGQVAWEYKHFFLASHPQARPAAEASECVAELAGNDAFWQFSESLFVNQASLGQLLYESEAQKVGVDIDEFKECVSSGRNKAKAEKDFKEGIAAGVHATPTSFIIKKGGGEAYTINGAQPRASFEVIIDNLLLSE